MATLTKAICVWLDSDSNYDDPTWIVSKDELDDAGCAVTTETISTHHDTEEAHRAAILAGEKFGLPVYAQGDGPAHLLAE